MSGSCVDEEAIVLGGSGSRSGNALMFRSNKSWESFSELMLSLFDTFSMLKFFAVYMLLVIARSIMGDQLTPIRC